MTNQDKYRAHLCLRLFFPLSYLRAMWSLHPTMPRTVGDVLRKPVYGRDFSSAPQSSLRSCSEDGPVFLSEAGVHVTQRPMPPPPLPLKWRLQSAPASRHVTDMLRKPPLPQTASRRWSAKPHEPQPTCVDQRSRRPVDEALFCALRMEGEGTVAAQLRRLGPERLTSDFRSLCSRLSMHHVTAAQFTFLCAAVLGATVSQQDCEVVFAFLRMEQGAGSLDVADLLLRLRTLFVSPDVLCALQLKRTLDANALSECTVSIDELQKAYAGLQRLLEPGAVQRQVAQQWRSLHRELLRIHVRYAVLVTTFCAVARRLAPALCAVVHALHWDGTWSEEWMGESVAPSLASSSPSAHSPVAADPPMKAKRCPPLVASAAASHTALLSAVTDVYRRRWAERETSARAIAAGECGGPFGAASRRASRRPSWRASRSAVDVTSRDFVADVYATGRVACSRK